MARSARCLAIRTSARPSAPVRSAPVSALRSSARCLTLASLVLSLAPAALGQQAKIEPVASGTPFTPTVGYRIDDTGFVVGTYSLIPSQPQAISWTSAGGVQILPPVQGTAGLGSARGLSADGSAIVGHSIYKQLPRAFRWTAAYGSLPLEPLNVPAVSYANSVSPDGSVIVGVRSETQADLPRAFRWTEQTGLVDLGSIDGGVGTSAAEDVSADGSVVVGVSTANESSPSRAFRWTSTGMQSLGTIGGVSGGQSYAWDVSADGTVVVGGSTAPDSRYHGFVWSTATETMEELPTIGNYAGDCEAYSISADGRVIAGKSSSAASLTAGEACVWIDRVPYSLRSLLETCGVDMGWWSALKQCRCSPDGRHFTGEGTYQGRAMGFAVGMWLDLAPTQIAADIDVSVTQWAEIGLPYRATFVATDPEGSDLTLSVTGLPTGATTNPPSGTTGPSPMTVVVDWTPQATEFGRGGVPKISFIDELGCAATRTFGLFGRQNETPTLKPLDPQRVECVDGTHIVELSTIVADGNGHPLTVTWSVDGEIEQTDANVASGSEVRFAFDYGHGAYDVEARVTDGYSAIAAGTVVTVDDTSAPVILAAPDVIVATDAGEAFASDVTLIEPTVSEASGHGYTLTNDGPNVYPLGLTIVTWTATDAEGFTAQGQQRVIVEDREMPTIAGNASVAVFVDPGTIVSAARPPVPTATDNVTDASQIEMTSDAPAQFPIGKTIVTFKATDGAGNVAEWPVAMTVINRRPRAAAGKDVKIAATSDRGARVSLDGSASSDPDRQKLKFDWIAAGLKLNGARSSTPGGRFPIGVTVVTLVVTDPAGAKSLDRVRVVVKRKSAKPRPRGRSANASFAQAELHAKRGLAAGAGGDDASSAHALSAVAQANAAARLGDAAGDEIQWEDDASYDDAVLNYLGLRSLQRAYGDAAARSLLAAYAESGDENLLLALGHAMRGTFDAQADVIEP